MGGKSIREQIKEKGIKEKVDEIIIHRGISSKFLPTAPVNPCTNKEECSAFGALKANGRCHVCGKVKHL